jgi:hypothetical protein
LIPLAVFTSSDILPGLSPEMDARKISNVPTQKAVRGRHLSQWKLEDVLRKLYIVHLKQHTGTILTKETIYRSSFDSPGCIFQYQPRNNLTITGSHRTSFLDYLRRWMPGRSPMYIVHLKQHTGTILTKETIYRSSFDSPGCVYLKRLVRYHLRRFRVRLKR